MSLISTLAQDIAEEPGIYSAPPYGGLPAFVRHVRALDIIKKGVFLARNSEKTRQQIVNAIIFELNSNEPDDYTIASYMLVFHDAGIAIPEDILNTIANNPSIFWSNCIASSYLLKQEIS